LRDQIALGADPANLQGVDTHLFGVVHQPATLQ